MNTVSTNFAKGRYAPTTPASVAQDLPKGRPETIILGGLPIAVVDRAEAAARMVEEALGRRGRAVAPHYQTSANGQVMVLCDRDPEVRALFMAADVIHADGMPMVYASHHMASVSLPERVATTDLVHDVMKLSGDAGLRSFLLGATPEVNALAVANLRKLYPDVPEIEGRDGYFSADEEAAVVDDINARAPDILWIGLGVPKEQAFVQRNLHRLTQVGVIKTSGGLFDFLSGHKARAPRIIQTLGFEWAWRAMLEPRRLGRRYLDTNFAALRLLLTKTD